MRKIALLLSIFVFSSNLHAMKTTNTEIKGLIQKAYKEVEEFFRAYIEIYRNHIVPLPSALESTLKELDFHIALIKDKQQLQNIRSDINESVYTMLTRIKSQLTIILSWQHMQYKDLEQKIVSNFKTTKINPRGAYEFLGLTTQAGINMPWTELKNKLQVRKKQLQQANQLTSDTAMAYRQLEYVFHYTVSKDEYDAYLKGSHTFDELKKSIKTYTELQHVFVMVQNYLMLLAEIDNTIDRNLKK